MIPRQKQPDESSLSPDPSADEQAGAPQHFDTENFLEEDQALERELNTFFNPEGEDLPPLFVQTLMSERNNWTIPPGLEQRLISRVFHRLQLRQPAASQPQKQPEQKPPGYQTLRRLPQRLGLGAALGLAMLLLVAFLPALGQEGRVLLIQAELSGSGYSSVANATLGLAQYLSPRQTAEAVPFPVYWLDKNPVNYTFQALLLHMGQSWSDGPVVELQYGHNDLHIGYGRLIIREFRPAGGNTSLEVVDPSGAQRVELDGTTAVSINGQWVQADGETFWQTGFQTQLLYQTPDGLVLWFIADARDEATLQSFELLVQSLEPLYLGPPRLQVPELNDMPQAEVAAALVAAVPTTVTSQLLVGSSVDQSASVYIALGALPGNPQNVILPVGSGGGKPLSG